MAMKGSQRLFTFSLIFFLAALSATTFSQTPSSAQQREGWKTGEQILDMLQKQKGTPFTPYRSPVYTPSNNSSGSSGSYHRDNAPANYEPSEAAMPYSGFNTYKFLNGDTYVGDFQNAARNGKGTLISAKGDTIYNGDWKNNEYEGTGVNFNNGRYSGEFKGNRRNGYGNFVEKNVGRYTGNFVNDVKSGRGTEEYVNRNKYTGEWQNDEMQGQGTFTWADGRKYTGSFTHNESNGFGTFYDAAGKELLKGTWLNDKYLTDLPEHIFNSGVKKYGDLKDDKLWGKGVYVTADGNIYSGFFENDVMNGPGKFTGTDGRTFEGNYVNDKPEGFGTFHNGTSTYSGYYKNGARTGQGTFSDDKGDVWTGEWVDGKLTGPGTFKGIDGEKYKGEFVNGKRNGNGLRIMPNGDQYQGNWEYGEMNGQGTMIRPDGTSYKGEWVMGLFSGKGVLIDSAGGKYEGDFGGGVYNGKGSYTFADGTKYDGEWVFRKRTGKGILYDKEGNIKQQGDWKDNAFIDVTVAGIAELKTVIEYAGHDFRPMVGGLVEKWKPKNSGEIKRYSCSYSINPPTGATVFRVDLYDYGKYLSFEEELEFKNTRDRDHYLEELKSIFKLPLLTYTNNLYRVTDDPKISVEVRGLGDEKIWITIDKSLK